MRDFMKPWRVASALVHDLRPLAMMRLRPPSNYDVCFATLH